MHKYKKQTWLKKDLNSSATVLLFWSPNFRMMNGLIFSKQSSRTLLTQFRAPTYALTLIMLEKYITICKEHLSYLPNNCLATSSSKMALSGGNIGGERVWNVYHQHTVRKFHVL